MTFRKAVLAICSAAGLALAGGSAPAQVIPDHFENFVPTRPTQGPMVTHKTLTEYLLEGYAIILRTRVSGRFDGCQKFAEVAFEDHSIFECLQIYPRAEFAPEVRILRKIDTGAQVIFIGDRPYVGRLLAKKGIRLRRVVHMGEELLGVPGRPANQRRSIGPVDLTNGMIPPIPANRSLDAGSIREVSADPPEPPPFRTTLNPVTINTARKLAAMGLAPPP